MDFEDTPEEAAFRHEVKTWLAEQAADYDLSKHGDISTERQLALGREFQALKAERGYAKVTWPKDLGGMGGTPMQAVIYDQEEEQYDLPTVFFAINKFYFSFSFQIRIMIGTPYTCITIHLLNNSKNCFREMASVSRG